MLMRLLWKCPREETWPQWPSCLFSCCQEVLLQHELRDAALNLPNERGCVVEGSLANASCWA